MYVDSPRPASASAFMFSTWAGPGFARLHPRGLAPRIGKLGQWRHHLFERLRQQVQATGDPELVAPQQGAPGFPRVSR